MAAKASDDDRSLKRLGGGRWQTRDERFTIEPQSGTWVIVDAEQTDDLGLPLVRGPFRSLTDAKAAVADARGAAAPESPLAGRVKASPKAAGRSAPADPKAREPAGGSSRRAKAEPPEEPREPRWISDLSPRDRGRARRLIEQLAEAGVKDAEGVVRQDLTGGVPTIPRMAVADRLADLLSASGGGAAKADERLLAGLIAAIADGRDEALGVRWRLLDGDGRPIGLTAMDVRAAAKRSAESASKKETRG
jgi:hypothetical protein